MTLLLAEYPDYLILREPSDPAYLDFDLDGDRLGLARDDVNAGGRCYFKTVELTWSKVNRDTVA